MSPYRTGKSLLRSSYFFSMSDPVFCRHLLLPRHRHRGRLRRAADRVNRVKRLPRGISPKKDNCWLLRCCFTDSPLPQEGSSLGEIPAACAVPKKHPCRRIDLLEGVVALRCRRPTTTVEIDESEGIPTPRLKLRHIASRPQPGAELVIGRVEDVPGHRHLMLAFVTAED